ncbi:MAG: multidrug effflux MFS transporter [Pseudomonadota bacterium]
MHNEPPTSSVDAPREFIALMAVLISLVALSIDAMLPALPDIGRDLGTSDPNQPQLVLTALFLGLSIGQLFYGPLSDSIGRKPAVYLGLAIFIIGCILSILATSFEMMLAGRVLQGLGAAGPRVVTVALIRDLFEGRAMARIMSFVMMVFIMVPAAAPAIGQAIQALYGWRAIFGSFFAIACIGLVWFWRRQNETLPTDARTPFALGPILAGILETVRNRAAFGYTLAGGLVFGSFVGFLVSSQQVFQQTYSTGSAFPAYFALLALAVGSASFFNGRVVMRFGMRLLSKWALQVMSGLSVAFTLYIWVWAPTPNFIIFMTYMMMSFFCFGLLLANLQSLAMEPLGHIAGVAAGVVSSVTTFMSLILGTIIGQAYDGTIRPLIAGLTLLALLSLVAVHWTDLPASRSEKTQ